MWKFVLYDTNYNTIMQLRSGKEFYRPGEFYVHNCATDNSQGIIRFSKCSGTNTLHILRELSNKIKKNKRYSGLIHWHEDVYCLTKYVNTSINRKY